MGGLESLNPAQARAASFGISGTGTVVPGRPLLIIAGAGSGKTRTLAYRVARLVAAGAEPGRILLLTFTRRAAEAMRRRVERILVQELGTTAPGRISWAGTFHATGNRLLREYARAIGLDPGFTVLDRSDAADLLNLVREELGLSAKEKRFPRKDTCLAIYSLTVNARKPLAEVLARQFPWCVDWEVELKALFRAYVEAKQRGNLLDYDDLLLYWARMLTVPELTASLGRRFDFVLVDEYQDTNALQAEILLGLKPDGQGLTVVGDDAQSIYAFRAATVRNILDFPKQFSPPAEVVTLEQNYRSTPAILAACNAVIGLAPERFTKNLFSERREGARPCLATAHDEQGEVDYVVNRVLEAREEGVPLREQAVLFRTGHHSGLLEVELTRRNIPFVKFGGLKFLEAAHIKDLIALQRWAENPGDRVSAFRVLQLLPGIGPRTARKAMETFQVENLDLAVLAHFPVPRPARSEWAVLMETLRQLTDPATPWPGAYDLARTWYQPRLADLYEPSPARSADLEQLGAIAATFESRGRFLAELALDPPGATGDEAGAPHLDEDYLILSTIHSAKGQEWTNVYVLRVSDGCIPSDMACGNPEEIEEERRLLYVAMTRARDELHLVHPQRFYTHHQARNGDRHVYAPRSRFLPDEILGHLERCAAGHPMGADSLRDFGRGARVDISVQIMEMWR